MHTPVLTPQQLQRTLSAKKKKQTVKNLLSSPYSNYWPVLNAHDCGIINSLLQQNLPVLKPEKVKIPWSVIKDIPREERKNYRHQASPNVIAKTGIALGINETTRLLEENGVSSILLAADVHPLLMIRHIIDMAVLKQIPVLLVSDLKNILKNLTGIGSVAMGVLNVNISGYIEIDKAIKEIATNYPVPTNHINYNRCTNSEKEVESMSDNDSLSSEDEIPKPTADLYLYRNSKERVFKPNLSKLPQTLNTTIESATFISLGNDNVPQDKPTKQKVSYKSLIIKRVKNNETRGKKKIELLKKQK